MQLEQLTAGLSLGSSDAGESKQENRSAVAALPGGGFSFAEGGVKAEPGAHRGVMRLMIRCLRVHRQLLPILLSSPIATAGHCMLLLSTLHHASECVSLMHAGNVVRRRFRRVETIAATVVR